ncbi:MAG: ATP-dependent DNA ligase [Acidobacteria bacterium]|nr:ATP-dependent DNA ligase [Acidobacteriota bacterium]
MRFAEVAGVSDAVAATSSRLDKIGRMAELVRRLAPDDVVPVVAWLSGAPRQGRIGIGHAAISAAAGTRPAEAPELTVADVDARLDELARVAGSGAARERARQLTALFEKATRPEQDFLRRLLYGELRQGALEGVVLEAVARAAGVSAARLRRAVLMAGDLPAAAHAALAGGERALDAIAVRVMQPIRPMLADSAEGLDAALDDLSDAGAALEYKLDGARVQLHKAGDDVRVFSRTLNDVTASVPEIAAVVAALPARSLILDGEVIALGPGGTPRPFQTTMRRFGRTRGVDDLRLDLPLTLFAFDCLLVDDAPLVDEPLERRVAVLQDAADALSVPRVVRPTRAEAAAFARDAADRGHEGVMAKSLAAPYAAGRRGAAWLKVKQARTLDLVVLAAEWGHGRRRGWLSNLHLGARDPATRTFVMLGKTFKGMTDEMLAWQTERLLSLEVARDGIVVFVRPELVVEVAFNEIQDSRVYAGGLALRFARVKRYRTDKTAEDANTIDDVRRLAGPREPG